MVHKWVYLGTKGYQCQNCGIEVTRDQMNDYGQRIKIPGCRLEAETRLEQLEISLDTKFNALDKRLKVIEGGLPK